MKKIQLLIVMTLIAGISHGQQVSREDAVNLAIEIQSWKYQNERITDSLFYKYEKNGHVLMYEVIMSNNEAVLLSGNYKCTPVLVMTNNAETSLLSNRDSLPDGLAFILDWYEEQIERAFDETDNSADYNASRQNWRSRVIPNMRITGVEPLLTSKWGQGVPYNEQMPQPIIGNCEHAKVGCVAVAIGQLMYYYNHPLLQEMQINQFDWCNMKDVIHGESLDIEKKAVSGLLASCADQVHSIYGCDNTTSLLNYGLDALVDNYKYNPNASFEFQENHSDNWWKSEIIGQLDRGNPVPYAGATNVWGADGHAFVCDGYNEFEKFHFNWGHNGRNQDHYCEITHIYERDSNNPFDQYLCAIFYAYPEDYLNLCNETIYLEDYYTPFYSQQFNGNISPCWVVPQTMPFLVSASAISDFSWRTIPTGEWSLYQAHKEIVLRDGFTSERGCDFTARIVPCERCEERDITESATHMTDGADYGNHDNTDSPMALAAGRMEDSDGLYPNPTDGKVTVATDGKVKSIVIYTLDGRPVGGWKFLLLTDSQATLDVSSLPDGIYILSLRTANGVATKKLTVVR